MEQVTESLFIVPGFDLDQQSPELPTIINLSESVLRLRWTSEHGQYILNRWKAHDFARSTLDEMVGRYYGHTDLRGIPLHGAQLRDVDLSHIDFFAANFEHAECDRVNLTDSWLSRTNLKGTVFKWSRMEGVLIDDVDFDDKTSFIGIDLKAINFTFAALLEENALVEPRIQHLRRRNPILAYFLSLSCDYGRSFPRFFCSCLAIIVAFTAAFYFVHHAINEPGLGNCTFFSFVTFFTASTNNLAVSSTIGRVLYISEAAIGYIMLGVLVSIILRRTIGR